MTTTSRLCLTLAIALAVVGTLPFQHTHAAIVAEAAPVPQAQAADVVDTFNYEQFESPPFWSHAKPINHNGIDILVNEDDNDIYIPIQHRRGGARGGDDSGHGRDGHRGGRRRRHFEKRFEHNSNNVKKRAVIYDDEHLELQQNLDFDSVITTELNIDLPNIQLEKRNSLKKRADVEDHDEEEEDEEDENAGSFFDVDGSVEFENDGETGVEKSLEVGGDGTWVLENLGGEEDQSDVDDIDLEGDFSEDQNEDDIDDNDNDEEGEEEEVYDEEDEEEEDEEEDGYDGVDDEEERRLDNEAGLQDWVEEMKSDEYFEMAGHPSSGGDDDDHEAEEEEGDSSNDDGMMHAFDEDEPTPSEEEIFAASWKH
ncbi:hypothetical protein BG004_007878 [Podila humilis]|nr:hypothetical protein BG004_007878 [Podila humilis]